MSLDVVSWLAEPDLWAEGVTSAAVRRGGGVKADSPSQVNGSLALNQQGWRLRRQGGRGRRGGGSLHHLFTSQSNKK